MSILNTSVSGMLANTSWLTTIAHNVANANTTGYKNVDTSFSALVDSAQNSSSQFAGVIASTVALNSLQGQVEQTTTKTDLAVQGAGFFVVQDTGGNIYLTRDGSFTPDASGNLVNADGYYLLGSPVGYDRSRAQLALGPDQSQRHQRRRQFDRLHHGDPRGQPALHR